MLVSVDKRGSIALPVALRKSLNLLPGTFLDLSVIEGGNLTLSPVAIYPTVRLSEQGLAKLAEARQGGTTDMPDWMREDIDAAVDSK
jgi:AbrB family looped-hinge helix DNA binding protein